LFHIVGSFLTFTFHKVVMGPLKISSLSDRCRVQGWKSFENRSTFAEVMGN